MKKHELREKIEKYKAENAEIIQSMYDALPDEHRDRFDRDDRFDKHFNKHGIKRKNRH